jgi:HSP20 family protein
MEESNFDITIDKNILVIRGNRIDKTNPEKKAYHQVEIGFGEFTTQIEINIPLDHENSSAQYDNGFLTIKIPKALPKQIKITKKD